MVWYFEEVLCGTLKRMMWYFEEGGVVICRVDVALRNLGYTFIMLLSDCKSSPSCFVF